MSHSTGQTHLVVTGGVPLHGSVRIQGSKNEVLKLMAASLLTEGVVMLENVPSISDVLSMTEILESLGVKVSPSNNSLRLDSSRTSADREPSPEAVRRIRASFVVVGPMLARFGRATIEPPGGDVIGARPLTTHLRAFQNLGVNVSQEGEKYVFRGQPHGDRLVVLQEMSVTATENVILSSVLSDARVTIEVAAAEPEVQDLCRCLVAMGARIDGIGTHRLTVQGVSRLKGVSWKVIPDRLDAGTFALAIAVTRGEATIEGVDQTQLALFLSKISDIGVRFVPLPDRPESLSIIGSKDYAPIVIDTRPYPGFPSDLQAPLSVLLSQANGTSKIFETLYEGRFGYVDDLKAMGADITVVDPHTIIVQGPRQLVGRAIQSVDIRAGATLLLAALCAKGESVVGSLNHIDRGYERIEERLRGLGADIKRMK